MLVVKLELDKSKENYQAVMAALAEFDIASTSWEDGSVNLDYKSGRTGDDLSSAVSDIISRAARGRGTR